MAKNLKNFLKKLSEETGAVSFTESKYGDINNWISTGSYALNRIISGSIYKGIPSGRVIILGRRIKHAVNRKLLLQLLQMLLMNVIMMQFFILTLKVVV